MIKQCSKCDLDFGCTNEKRGCWCEELKLNTETLEELRRQFQNCLCPACIKDYEQLDER